LRNTKENDLFNKILVPLDGSQLAEKAIPFAEEMIAKFGASVTLLSTDAPEDTPKHDEYYEYLNKTQAVMEQDLKKYAPAKKAKINTAITGRTGLLGDPASEILDYADKEDFNMIIMATHGRTGITRWVLGGTANKIARTFSCPLMLIRAKAVVPKPVDIKKVLVPLDGSRESESVLPFVETIAAKLRPDITLVHIVELLYHVTAYPEIASYGGAGIVRTPYSPDEMKPFQETGEKYLKSISDSFMKKGIRHTTELRTGIPAAEIIEMETKLHPDLVVMSTHGQSGFGRFDNGSVTDKVLHAGTTPLLMVRPQPSAPGSSVGQNR
jgi:nucleotide-binding universal stress UspA family protein